MFPQGTLGTPPAWRRMPTCGSVASKWCQKAPDDRLEGSLFASRFRCFCRDFLSTGGRARTDTVLSHHRILSPARLPIPPLRRAEPQHYTNVYSPLDIRGEWTGFMVLDAVPATVVAGCDR